VSGLPPADEIDIERPLASVIVPVRDDLDSLVRCLDALAAQTYPVERYEIIVVDDGSAVPIEPALAGGDGRRLLRRPPTGSYAARNAGIAASRGDVLAFTDADCLPATDWLERGVGRVVASAETIVGGAIEIVSRGRGAVDLYEVETALRQEEYVRVGGFAATANLFAARVVFERAGTFDEALQSAGDVEWCRRAVRAGYQLVYEAGARVRHPTRQSVRQVCRRARRLSLGYETLAHRAGSFYVGPPRLYAPESGRVIVDVMPPVRAAARFLTNVTGRPGLTRLGAVAVLICAHYAGVFESAAAKVRRRRR
jgi:glycosyltransferase involved in cell wall biosynthesis